MSIEESAARLMSLPESVRALTLDKMCNSRDERQLEILSPGLSSCQGCQALSRHCQGDCQAPVKASVKIHCQHCQASVKPLSSDLDRYHVPHLSRLSGRPLSSCQGCQALSGAVRGTVRPLSRPLSRSTVNTVRPLSGHCQVILTVTTRLTCQDCQAGLCQAVRAVRRCHGMPTPAWRCPRRVLGGQDGSMWVGAGSQEGGACEGSMGVVLRGGPGSPRRPLGVRTLARVRLLLSVCLSRFACQTVRTVRLSGS